MVAKNPTSWASIAQGDRRLREAAESSSAALASYRYEHTIAVGVSFNDYARHVGVDPEAVRRYAKAHEFIILNPEESSGSFDVAMVRAGNTADRAAVVEAVAEVKGIKPTVVDTGHRHAVRRVRQMAEDRAERRGTSVSEEAPNAARSYETMRRAEKRRNETKAANTSIRFLTIDQDLDRARSALIHALNESHGVEWDDESRELITDALAKVKAVIALLDARFTGMTDVDWDRELARLGEDS